MERRVVITGMGIWSCIGMTAELGLYISLICRVREIIWATIGLLLMRAFNNK